MSENLVPVRCPDCQRLLGKVSGSFELKCKCKPGAIVRGWTVACWIVLMDPLMPPDMVKFVNQNGVVGKIVNLADDRISVKLKK